MKWDTSRGGGGGGAKSLQVIIQSQTLASVQVYEFGQYDDDDDNDDDDDYCCNSVTFQARTSRFCMEIDLDNTYNMMVMKMMIMMLMTMMMMMMMIR